VKRKYVDEEILDNMSEDQMMHRLTSDLRIHDETSSKYAITYLDNHYNRDSKSMKDLVARAKELKNAEKEIKK